MRPAFVTGGSSGIGLAAAVLLAKRGHDIALFARDPGRLAAARQVILDAAPDISVREFPVDVSDRAAVESAVAEAVAAMGVPGFAIASAGIAEPGLFAEQPVDLHERHMAINYFGALYFVRALTGPMADAGGGKVGLVSSGAAFFGIYGYSSYAPSKFALRGLGEVLHVELEPRGIDVTICYPPDTQTPMLEAEMATKPAATVEITRGGGLWQAEAVAARLIAGMQAGRLVVAPGFQMAGLNRFTSLIAPILRWHQRRLIRKFSE
ncbi:SDR family NAD(P)-dependent oxidoreductase [Thiosulfatihalobacter marinus]|jgi:3-dehydrosphinganine reductase|uniref:SDR family NAD(P)-dependent oxidoreductase n=1 Tax=Thiosulfatihalobacter marinus TaxID=2792481 RepID=UPI0018D87741|nr:SDR family NAD(P)-dependent oxidoreductase [Thiosulfatihalobacter marinus]